MGSYTLINTIVIIGIRLRYVTRQSTGLADFDIPLAIKKANHIIYFSCTDTIYELSDFTLGNDFVVLLSFATIAVWFYYHREMIMGHFLNIMWENQNYRRILGARSSTIARIDQAKLDKQKYNRGSRVVSH
ncbi:uncharacterized protein LOC117161028 [Bombus vancouverensis nearcticus]|uniref:uncharacterized protein LOC117161028 n=1 Tax=Bombus vancouverensis nearcticus TaxID=2705178 RepID=UPI00402B8BED